MRLQLESATDVFNLDDVLMKDEGVQAVAGVTGLGLPDIATQWLEGAGDGALFRGQRVLPRDIDLPLYLAAPDRAGLQLLVSRLARMLAGPCTLRLVEDDGSSWYVEVRRVGGGGYVYGSDTNGERDLTLIITLRAGVPFWTYSQPSRKTIENSGAGRGLLNGSMAKLQVASSQAIGSITLENLGDADAFPVWEVSGPGNNFRARSADGQEFLWTGSLAAGEKLIVDTAAGTVKDGTGANRYGEMAPAPRLWSIPPGTTTAEATLENTSSGTIGPTGDPIWKNLVTNPRGETQSSSSVLRTNLMTNPRPRNYASSATAPTGWQDTWAGGGTANFTSDANGVVKKTWTANATSDHNVFAGPRITSPPIGVKLSARMKIRISASPNGMPTSGMALRFDFRDAGNVSLGTATGNYVTWGALGEWMTVECVGATAPANTAHVRIIPLPNDSTWKPQAGTVIEMSEPLVEAGAVLGIFFDGDFTGSFTYAWTGTAGASTSTQSQARATDQRVSVNSEVAAYFPYWSEGSAGSRYQRWRAIAGTPAASFRVARSSALDRTQVVAGQTYTLLARMRLSGWDASTVRLRVSDGGANQVFALVDIADVGSSWKDVRHTFTAAINGTVDSSIGLYCTVPLTPPDTAHGYFDLAHWAIVPGSYSGDYFDGDTADSLQQGIFAWSGTAHASVSTNTLAAVTGRSSITCTWRPRKWMVI